MSGKLIMYIGPMYASKSTELIREANRYKSINKKILTINHSLNNRYNTTNISTHNNIVLDNCVVISELMRLFNSHEYVDNKPDDYDVIIIEEVQFFDDAVKFILLCLNTYKKTIICAGLSADYNNKPFPVISALIPHTDQLTKLSSYCSVCLDGTPAIYSKILKSTIMEE